jgi:hypothetical protein
MDSFNRYFKSLLLFVFFIFIVLYVFSFSTFTTFTSFVDEEIVIFIAIALVSYFFLKLNLKELSAGVDSRIILIENEFKKNYKLAVENLIALESVFQKSKNLSINIQKNFNFFFNEFVFLKFNDLEDRFFKELFLLPKINFLKIDFVGLINSKKDYKNSIVTKTFDLWNQKSLFKSNFLIKNSI